MKGYYPEVYQYLHKGHANAVPLKVLISLTGKTGSHLRMEIEKMVESGVAVVNMEDGKGYFLPETPEEIEVAHRKKYSRAKKLMKSCYHLKKAQNELLYANEGLLKEN